MKSISFVNPLVLLVALPIIALVITAFLIAIRKEGRTKDTVISLVLHVLITVLAVTAAAGMTYTAVITKTEVVVVADVSDSLEGKLDLVDERIKELERSFIGNTDLAVVTFGRDYELTTAFGDRFETVKDSGVNTADTDISSALDYASTLFGQNSIKRLVIITDAMSTGKTGDSDVIRSVNNLYSLDVQVDAIFMDSNLPEGAKEVQVNSVDYNKSTYKGHTTTFEALITSSYDKDSNGGDVAATVKLYRGDEVISSKPVKLTRGFNIVSFDVTANEIGTFDYSIEVTTRDDTTVRNNSIEFTQRVSGELRVLLVTSTKNDRARAQELYGDNVELDVYNTSAIKPGKLPCTVEELIAYDEILISNVNILDLPNYTEFINSLDTVVGEYGKSLVTFGNNNVQNKEEECFKKLENMLPVNFGNNERDAALVTLVIDISKSMNTASRLNTAREMMKEIVKLLSPEDKICIIPFYADNYVELDPTEVGDMTEVFDIIDNKLIPMQGTIIGSAVERALATMKDLNYQKKQCIVISDGLTFVKETDTDPAIDAAATMHAYGIAVSTINMWSPSAEALSVMEGMAEVGGGTAYYIEGERDYEGKIKTEFADMLYGSIVEETTDVIVKIPEDSVLEGIDALPQIDGFITPGIKNNATTVLAVNWQKTPDATLEVPLFAYWDYGNGRVATVTTTLTGEWVANWNDESTDKFYDNLVNWAVPSERINYPYTINVSEDGTYRKVELVPAEVNLDAVARISITSPLGETVEYDMIFDGKTYTVVVDVTNIGRYDMHIEYQYPGSKVFAADTSINVSYSKEHDAFLVYSDRMLFNAIRGRGEVVGEGEIPAYEYDESRLTTYVMNFTVPFLIAACALFVIDVIVRKLKWSDIINLFRKIKRG